jgi:hypothetical protein
MKNLVVLKRPVTFGLASGVRQVLLNPHIQFALDLLISVSRGPRRMRTSTFSFHVLTVRATAEPGIAVPAVNLAERPLRFSTASPCGFTPLNSPCFRWLGKLLGGRRGEYAFLDSI